MLLSDDTGHRDCMVIVEVSLDTELLSSIQLYTKEMVFEWHGTQLSHLGKRLCRVTVEVSKDTELLESVVILVRWS